MVKNVFKVSFLIMSIFLVLSVKISFKDLCFSIDTVHAFAPDSCILGPGDGVSMGPSSDNLSSNGRNAETVWKAFRWQAGGSGDIYVGAVRVESIPRPEMVSSVDLQFAVYEDNNGNIGGLKAWGHKLGYDFRTIGVGRHYFDLTNVVTDRRVTAGSYYWIAWRSNMTPTGSENYIYFERQGNDPLPPWIEKRGLSVAAGNFGAMPPSGPFDIFYDDNYYGWSVWTAKTPRKVLLPAGVGMLLLGPD